MYKWEMFVEGGEDRKERRRKKERERKERKSRKEKREREKKGREKEGEKEIGVFFSLAFRRLELVGPRSKVYIFDKGYAPRGRDSSYFGLFPL